MNGIQIAGAFRTGLAALFSAVALYGCRNTPSELKDSFPPLKPLPPIVCRVEFEPGNDIPEEEIALLNYAVSDLFFFPLEMKFSRIEIRAGDGKLLKDYPAGGTFQAFPEDGSKSWLNLTTSGQLNFKLPSNRFPFGEEDKTISLIFEPCSRQQPETP